MPELRNGADDGIGSFESEPPGAEAKTSNGQYLPHALRARFAQRWGGRRLPSLSAGYQPDSEKLDLVAMGDGTSQLRPNPLLVELTPLPPPPKSKKPAPKKKRPPPSRQPSLRQPGPQEAPRLPPTSAQPQQAPAPWPAAPQR